MDGYMENDDYQYQQNNKAIKMAELTNSNVQFFHSESSFGSEALSNSRIYDLADELIDESNTIFYSLQQILVPREDLLDQGAVKQILHRARIMHRDTIPENLVCIQRSPNCQGRISSIKNCDQKLRILLQNYESLKDTKMLYQEFYNIYGRVQIPNFSRKQPLQINIQPDVVQIYESVMPKSLKGAASKQNIIPSIRQGYKDRQIQQLKDQIHFLKKKQKNFLKEKEESQLRLKVQTDDRVKRLIKMHKNPTESVEIQTLKQQLQKYQFQLQTEYGKNKKLNGTIENLQQTIKQLRMENKMIKQQLQSNRRIAMGSSRISDLSDGGRSVYSQVDGVQGVSDVKKLHKMIKNLNYEKNLIRSQLNKERETFYKIKKGQQKSLQQEIAHLKKAMQKKNQQLADSHKELDRYKVENIKLMDQYQKVSKQLGLAKNSVQNLEKMSFQESRMSNTQQMIMRPSQAPQLDLSRAFKLMITSYNGDGDEGYPYFDLLNKQFKIRFKRACLRQKQLLYKTNGLQVGVISEYIKPNEIKIMLHLSNFCDQQPLYHIKLKVSNSKSNKIALDKSAFDKIDIGQQCKTSLHFSPKTYPLGSTVLICEYQYYGKKEEVRILLPAHIFKMITVKPKDGEFRQIQTVKVPFERKIAKNMDALKQYLKGATVEQNKIKATLMHDQSQTKILIQISQEDQNFVINYEQRSGDEMISDYIIKTLAFLLKKQK